MNATQIPSSPTATYSFPEHPLRLTKDEETKQPLTHSLKHWAKDDQPREKLLLKGPDSLTDSELIAILIGTGTAHRNAVDLAREVLKKSENNLLELGRCTIQQLTKIKGIGKAKAVTIAAAVELGRRRQSAAYLERPVAEDSRCVAGYLRPLLMDLHYEAFGALYLTQTGNIIQFEIVSRGGIASTTVDPRLILKKALELEAVSLIVCHNHPSGSLHPSKSDEALTAKIRQGAQYMDIRLLDHIIVGMSGYFSFADNGLLEQAA